jgi:hypothetical protein
MPCFLSGANILKHFRYAKNEGLEIGAKNIFYRKMQNSLYSAFYVFLKFLKTFLLKHETSKKMN